MCIVNFFFFNDTATTEIYTLSLHDALPIYRGRPATRKLFLARARRRAVRAGERLERAAEVRRRRRGRHGRGGRLLGQDRKSTRLNSSHANISYAVFCLKKKTKFLLSTYVCL